MRILRFTALTVVAILTFAAAAEAACLTTDMNNTRWFAYIGFTDGWSRCTVNVGSDGAVTGGTCSSYEFGVGTETESVTAGSLAITTGCVVTGFIRTNLSGRHTLTHAALDKGKSVLIGVGKDTNGEAWQFSAVKR